MGDNETLLSVFVIVLIFISGITFVLMGRNMDD
jgi:hypothetical protein